MRGKAALLLPVVLLAFCRPAHQEEVRSSVPVQRMALPPTTWEKLAPGLRQRLRDPRFEGRLRVLVDLADQVDLHALGRLLVEQGEGKLARRQRVVAALNYVAARNQAALRPLLDQLRQRGLIEAFESFSIVSRLLIVGSPAAVRALSERPEVAAIAEETEQEVPALTQTAPPGRAAEPERTSWAIRLGGADQAWRQGLNGNGVTVGTIDAGASAVHEQLQRNFRGGDRSWYDPVRKSRTPQDTHRGHGTGVLSGAVGQNVGGVTVGVAPGAVWIACAGIPEGRFNNILLTQCADWILRVGQPDVLINAWRLPGGGCDRSLHRIVDAWRTAEMLPVFAAGNGGPGPQTDQSPANYVGLYPGGAVALSVGGIGKGSIALTRSSRGPNSCNGSIFPVIVAPADDVAAAFPLSPSTYVQASGTSVAAGFVAGAAAILLQRHPEASVTEIEDALRAGARDVGPRGSDNTFGYGQLNIPGALEWLNRTRSGAASTESGR